MRIVAAVVLVASLAHAEPWEQRVNAFRAKATAERKRLGLDAEKAKKAYPTPEVRFGVAPNASVVACPGETSTVFLHGKLAPGTLVGAISPEVQIVKEQYDKSGVRVPLFLATKMAASQVWPPAHSRPPAPNPIHPYPPPSHPPRGRGDPARRLANRADYFFFECHRSSPFTCSCNAVSTTNREFSFKKSPSMPRSNSSRLNSALSRSSDA